jgi:hypothetical protein
MYAFILLATKSADTNFYLLPAYAVFLCNVQFSGYNKTPLLKLNKIHNGTE